MMGTPATADVLDPNGQRYVTMFTDAVVGMYRNLPNGEFIEVNDAFAVLLGYESPQKLCAQLRDPARQLYRRPELRARHCALLERNTRATGLEFEVRRQDGRGIWIRVNARAHRDPEGRVLYYHGCAEEISGRKAREKALRYRNADLSSRLHRLERANEELLSYSDLAGEALKISLHAVTDGLLAEATPLAETAGDEGMEIVQRALSRAGKMQLLIDDLMVYFRLEQPPHHQPPPRLTDCNALVYQAMQSARIALEESGAVIICTRLPAVRGVTAYLSLLFRNLIDYLTSSRAIPRRHVSISASRKEDFWLFEIRDTKVDTESEEAPRIFQPFRLTNTDRGSKSNLNLAICEKIVRGHGGMIWTTVEPTGVAETLFFTLPAT